MVVTSYKFGEWNKNPDVLKSWTRADYLINNQELYFDKQHIEVLQPLHARKSIFLKMLLYAMFDLTEKENKDIYNFSEIFKTIQKNKLIYKLLIKRKADFVLQRINERKYINSNKGFNQLDKLKATKQKFMEGMNNRDKLQNHDLYYGLALLFGIFINHKVYSKNKDYNEIDDEESKYYNQGYFLNKDGKILMRKFKEEGYLL